MVVEACSYHSLSQSQALKTRQAKHYFIKQRRTCLIMITCIGLPSYPSHPHTLSLSILTNLLTVISGYKQSWGAP